MFDQSYVNSKSWGGIFKMNGHERLEFEMAVDQVKETLPKITELAYEYFSQLLKSGFEEKQALFLVAQYVGVLLRGDSDGDN